ncbi:MAG: hypothetical protein J6Z45_06210 [Oscillospiraceae bacterium]|nr:hypothetical protein [Oscillospiraceae bacterium]
MRFISFSRSSEIEKVIVLSDIVLAPLSVCIRNDGCFLSSVCYYYTAWAAIHQAFPQKTVVLNISACLNLYVLYSARTVFQTAVRKRAKTGANGRSREIGNPFSAQAAKAASDALFSVSAQILHNSAARKAAFAERSSGAFRHRTGEEFSKIGGNPILPAEFVIFCRLQFVRRYDRIEP